MLKLTSKTIDKIPVAGKAVSLPIKGVEQLNKANNFVLWDYLHPSAKLATVNAAYEKATLKYAKIQAKDPAAKVPSPDKILEEVVGVTNTLFGGIQWRKMVDTIENRWLHKQLSSLTNPQGNRALRLALIAPDWLVSSVVAGVKGGMKTVKGLIPGTEMSIADDMYRRYFLGSALMGAVIMEGMQQHYTGKHFWENEDPLSVDFGDGTSMNVFKHFGEIFHLFADPRGFIVNKLGPLPKEAVAQLLSKEYVSTKRMPPMQDDSLSGRVGHALKSMLPISAQEVIQGHTGRALSGAVGLPTKGMTREERMAQRKARAAARNTPEAKEARRKIRERNRQRGY